MKLLKYISLIGALIAPISVGLLPAKAQTQQQVLNSIASNLPTSNANEISALALRNTLNYMTSAIFAPTGPITLIAPLSITGLTVTPGGNQPLCINTTTNLIYAGTGSAC